MSTRLPRSTPEAQGISSAAISAFLNGIHANSVELHSLMLLRHGQVVAEGWWSPYTADRVHLLYSLSKSFTSTAIGLAVEEGHLTVDDPVLSFFPDEAPDNPNEHLTAMRVHHLLCMGTGHREDTMDRMFQQSGGTWAQRFLSIPPDQAPGSVFTYNNGATYMLSAILQKVTGEMLLDYLRPRLLDPLGISPDAYWFENEEGINLGFTGFHITTEDIARFGQLYLQKGRWNGQQLVPQAWIETATSKHIDNYSRALTEGKDDEQPDWQQGYGYQFWMCRHDAYRGDGAFGQFCVVIPEQDALLVTTSGNGDMQIILDLAWQHLLPVLQQEAEETGETLAHETLITTLDNLHFAPLHGESSSPVAPKVSGTTWRFDADQQQPPDRRQTPIEEMSFEFGEDVCMVKIVEVGQRGEQRTIRCGYNEWLESTITRQGGQEVPVFASGGWVKDEAGDADLWRMKVIYVESPHSITFTCNFQLDAEENALLYLDREWNVHFSEEQPPQLIGKRA